MHMYLLVSVKAGTKEEAVEAIDDLMEPFSENLDVKPYRIEVTQKEIDDAVKYCDEHEPSKKGLTPLEKFAYYEGVETDDVITDGGKVYKMSTWNPEGRWDWWVVGGRWMGKLIPKASAAKSDLIGGRPGVMDNKNEIHIVGDEGETALVDGVDGARICDLDIEGMRANAVRDGMKRYYAWHKFLNGRPFRTWKDIGTEMNYSKEARDIYHGQEPMVEIAAASNELVKKLRDDPEYVLEDDDPAQFGFMHGGPPEYANMSVERAEMFLAWSAVPGYACLFDGKWMARERYVPADREIVDESASYYEAANAAIDSMSDDTWLIGVDYHS